MENDSRQHMASGYQRNEFGFGPYKAEHISHRLRQVPSFGLAKSLRFQGRHCVQNLKDIKYKNIWAWVLKGAKEYKAPFDYHHSTGAVIFVRVRESMGPQ